MTAAKNTYPAPPPPPPIADMYGRWTLDYCIVETALAIAKDFVVRPKHYRYVPDKIAQILEDFRYKTGNEALFPNMSQRLMIFNALLGESDGKPGGEGTSQFHLASAALRERASDFSNRQVSTGEDNLRQEFREAAISFRVYLDMLEKNTVVSFGDKQTRNLFEKAVVVLRDKTVAGVFGLPPTTAERDWPLVGDYDSNGSYLIEAITGALQPNTTPMSQDQFVVLQRVAHHGARTIRGVLGADLDSDAEIDGLIRIAYSWKKALGSRKWSMIANNMAV